MNPIQIIATLRKLGNYLAGLFPFLARFGDWLTRTLKDQFAGSISDERLAALRNSTPVASAWKFIERFYWRNYSKDRIDFNTPPPESLVVLRPIFQLCALLCVLIPFTGFEVSPVSIETFSGFKGMAPSWSILLWIVILPCAWSSLLAGAALSNRIVFCITAVSAIYFLSTCALLLPRDFGNSFLAAAALLSLFYCERNLLRRTKVSQTLSLFNTIVTGSAAGIQLYILTPLKPMLAPHLPGGGNPAMTLVYGGILGSLLAMVCTGIARSALAGNSLPAGDVPPGKVVWSLAVLIGLYLTLATLRGGLAAEGGMLISSVGLINGYLWPIWYFVGVGVVHKLIGSSKTVTATLEGLLPPKALTPALLLLLFTITCICGSDAAALALSTASGFPAQSLFFLFAFLFNQTKSWLWSQPLVSMAAHWLLYVLMVDVAVVFILAPQRKLTGDAMMRLFYLTGLAALLIWEYLFQLSSFARTPAHSVVALFLFSVWLLWLMHTVGWNKSLQSSPAWPSRGRLPIFAGVLALALIEIHARGASKDFKVVNEIFLVMFRGAVDIGLPYFLFIWISRRVPNLPVKTASMLGLFSMGALTAFVFNVLDKLACANYNVGSFMQMIDKQAQSLLNTGNINIPQCAPEYELILKSVLYTGLLVMILYFSGRHYRSQKSTFSDSTITPHSNIANMFLLMAFGSGVGAFSHALVELPLPVHMRALLAPLVQETTFNCNVFLSYLAYWLPALIIGAAQTVSAQSARRKTLFLATITSMVFNFSAFVLYRHYEAYLRATDTLYLAFVMLAGVLLVLIMYGVNMIVPQTPTKPVLLSSRSFIALILTIEVVCAAVTSTHGTLKLKDVPIAAVNATVAIADDWIASTQPSPAEGKTGVPATFARQVADGTTDILQIGEVTAHPAGTGALLKTLLATAVRSGQLPGLQVLKVDPWYRFGSDALACSFSWTLPAKKAGTPGLAESGLTVVVPGRTGKVLFFTLFTSPSSIERKAWEVALAVQRLQLR